MGLGHTDFRSFHRHLYAGVGVLETVRLLRRGDNQNAGSVTEFKLFDCRWSKIYQTGQEIDGSLSSDNQRTLHVPQSELDRAGAGPIRVLDRFIDKEGRVWEPESPLTIVVKLALDHLDIPCKRLMNAGGSA